MVLLFLKSRIYLFYDLKQNFQTRFHEWKFINIQMYLRQLCLKSNTLGLKPAGRREQSAFCKRDMDGILLNIIVSVDESEKHEYNWTTQGVCCPTFCKSSLLIKNNFMNKPHKIQGQGLVWLHSNIRIIERTALSSHVENFSWKSNEKGWRLITN